MTAGRAAKEADEPQRETLSGRDVTVLGRLRRSVFARTKDGREIRLRGPVQTSEQVPANGILVRQQVRTSDGRPRTDTYVGNVVVAGTFERLQRQKTYRPKERARRPIDGLYDVRYGAAREVVRLGRGDPDGGSYRDIARDALSRRPGVLFTDGIAPTLTVAATIDDLNRKGANLRRPADRTLADWSALSPYWSNLLVRMYYLIDAAMAGSPASCSYEHEAPTLADTLDPAGVPVCNGHIGLGPQAA
jgi:hypothetical protein